MATARTSSIWQSRSASRRCIIACNPPSSTKRILLAGAAAKLHIATAASILVRVSCAWDKRMSDNSFLSAWTTWENGGEGGVFRPDDLVALKNSGLRYVLYNPEFIFSHAEQRYPQALAELLGEPILVSEGAALYDLERFTGITAITTPPPRLSPRLQPADGHQPAMGQRPTPPPWTLLRTTSTPIAGVHPNAPAAKP